MIRTKKMLLLSLTAAFAFSLTACAGSGTNNSASSDPSASPDASASANPSAEASPSASSDDVDYDLGGRTITIASWWDPTPKGETEEEKKILQNIAEYEKQYNFKLKFMQVDYGQIADKTVSSALAGQPFADVVRLTPSWIYPGMIKKGILQPLDDLMEVAGMDKQTYNDPIINKLSTYNGKLYGFSPGRVFTYTGILYNRTLLQKLNMKDLQEYVKDGTWNWDTFKKVAQEATQGDSYGLASWNGSILDNALLSNGADLIDLESNKQTLDDPRTVEAMQFTQDVSNATFIPKGVAKDWQAPTPAFQKGNVLMMDIANWQVPDMKQKMKDIDLGFVPYPKGPSATAFYSNDSGEHFWTIPKGVKDPEKVLYLVRKIYDVPSDEEYLGQTWLEKEYAKQEDIDAAIEASKNLAVLNYPLLMSVYSNDFYAMLDELTTQKKSPAAATASHKNVFQKALDDNAGDSHGK
ncbi:ABC transporter substrate-binding protein [Cohnella sp. REN36]|uniref:ABC transporter substrate-binding protein n=1 Tax=Cohnella sp. REN36 TaxID=2887347 RepID=UPI001D1507D1|nr:extracellular solute-binding protein [Cohnella sp. REN36]MCC3372031.1 extracellular solute-binding protein [Cohnella sp. REN36]